MFEQPFGEQNELFTGFNIEHVITYSGGLTVQSRTSYAGIHRIRCRPSHIMVIAFVPGQRSYKSVMDHIAYLWQSTLHIIQSTPNTKTESCVGYRVRFTRQSLSSLPLFKTSPIPSCDNFLWKQNPQRKHFKKDCQNSSSLIGKQNKLQWEHC